MFSFTVYQRNIPLIQRNCFSACIVKFINFFFLLQSYRFWKKQLSLCLFFWKFWRHEISHPENSFFESKKYFFDIQWRKFFFWIKESSLDLLLKENFFNQQNFLQFKEILSLTVYQRNVSLIKKKCFLGVFLHIL